MAERSLTIQIRVQDRTAEQEAVIVAAVKKLAAAVAGDPRPTVELAQASREAVNYDAGAGS